MSPGSSFIFTAQTWKGYSSSALTLGNNVDMLTVFLKMLKYSLKHFVDYSLKICWKRVFLNELLPVQPDWGCDMKLIGSPGCTGMEKKKKKSWIASAVVFLFCAWWPAWLWQMALLSKCLWARWREWEQNTEGSSLVTQIMQLYNEIKCYQYPLTIDCDGLPSMHVWETLGSMQINFLNAAGQIISL